MGREREGKSDRKRTIERGKRDGKRDGKREKRDR